MRLPRISGTPYPSTTMQWWHLGLTVVPKEPSLGTLLRVWATRTWLTITVNRCAKEEVFLQGSRKLTLALRRSGRAVHSTRSPAIYGYGYGKWASTLSLQAEQGRVGLLRRRLRRSFRRGFSGSFVFPVRFRCWIIIMAVCRKSASASGFTGAGALLVLFIGNCVTLYAAEHPCATNFASQ